MGVIGVALLSNVSQHAAAEISDWYILGRGFPDAPVPAEMTQSMETTCQKSLVKFWEAWKLCGSGWFTKGTGRQKLHCELDNLSFDLSTSQSSL